MDQFEVSVSRACSNQNATMITRGDLNFPGRDWTSNVIISGTHIPLHRQFKDRLGSNHLIQLVQDNTSKDNIFDLLITNTPSIVQRIDFNARNFRP